MYKSMDDLLKALKKQSYEKRLAIVQQNAKLIQDIDDLTGILEKLKGSDRLTLVREKADLITESDELTDVLEQLNESDRLVLALERSDIELDKYDLVYVIDLLAADKQKMEFIHAKLAIIKTVDDFILVCEKLEAEQQQELTGLLAGANHYCWSVQDLKTLEQKNWFTADVKRSYLMMRKVKNFPELTEVLKMDLCDKDRIDFLNYNSQVIVDGMTLYTVLGALEKEDRLAFARQHAKVIKADGLLGFVLLQLNEEDRFSFVNDCPDAIPNITMLTCVLAVLENAQQKVECAERYVGYIKSARLLGLVLNCLNVKDRCDFAIKHIEVVNEGEDLSDIINILTSEFISEDCLEFANEYMQRRPSVDAMVNLISSLPVRYQLIFASKHAGLIKNVAELCLVLERLDAGYGDPYQFAKTQYHRIRFDAELEIVAQSLGRDERAFISEYKSSMADKSDAAPASQSPLSSASVSANGLFSSRAQLPDTEDVVLLRLSGLR